MEVADRSQSRFVASGDEFSSFMKTRFEAFIYPNAMEIAKIVENGDVAVVMAGPGEKSRVLKMQGKARIAKEWRDLGDEAAARWLSGFRRGRIFYVDEGLGTLCINFSPSDGYSLEPGTTDSERKTSIRRQ